MDSIETIIKDAICNEWHGLPGNKDISFKIIARLEIGEFNYSWKINKADVSVYPKVYGVTKWFKTEYGVKNNLIAYLKKNPL